MRGNSSSRCETSLASSTLAAWMVEKLSTVMRITATTIRLVQTGVSQIVVFSSDVCFGSVVIDASENQIMCSVHLSLYQVHRELKNHVG